MEKFEQTIAVVLLLIFVGLIVRFDMDNKRKVKIFSSPSPTISGGVKFFWSNVKIDSLIIYKAHPRPERIVKLKEEKTWFVFYRPGIYTCFWYVKGRSVPIVSSFLILKNRPKHISKAFFYLTQKY